MEFLTQNAEGVLALVSMVVGVIWALVKSSEWWQKRVRANYTSALEDIGRLAAATVERTYREKVKELKKDGELSEEDKRQVREYALKAFQEEGKELAQKYIQKFGAGFIQSQIQERLEVVKSTGLVAKSLTGNVFLPEAATEKE